MKAKNEPGLILALALVASFTIIAVAIIAKF